MTTQDKIISDAQAEVADLKIDAKAAANDLLVAADAYFQPEITEGNFLSMPSWDATVPTADQVGTSDLVVGDAPPLPEEAISWVNDAGREVSLGNAPDLDAESWENKIGREVGVGNTPNLLAESWTNEKAREVALGDAPELIAEAWAIAKARELPLAGLGDLPGDRPTMNEIDFVFNPDDYITNDFMQKYAYQSEFFDNFLEPQLKTFIQAESYFINQEVQDALFQQTRERDLQTLNDALDAVDRQQAQRGFPIPISMSRADRNDVTKKYQDTQADRNKEITALIAERAHDGVKHSVDASIKMEGIRAQFQLGFGTLYFRVTDYLIRKYEADIKAEIARVEGEIDQIRIKAGLDTASASNDLTYEGLDSQMNLALLGATIDEYKTDARFVEIASEIGLKLAANDLTVTELDSRMNTALLDTTMEEYKTEARFTELATQTGLHLADNDLKSTGFDSQMNLALLGAELDRFKTDARFVELKAEIELKLAGNDLALTDIDSRMNHALLDTIMRKYAEDAKVNLVEADLGKAKQQVIMDMVRYDHEKQIARLKSTIDEVGMRVETWKKSAQMGIDAAAGSLDYYANAVLGTASQINAINYLDET